MAGRAQNLGAAKPRVRGVAPMPVTVDVTRYRRETGRLPRGRGIWCFFLRTDRVTEKDHYHNPGTRLTYPAALKRAIALAERRRAHTVEVMP